MCSTRCSRCFVVHFIPSAWFFPQIATKINSKIAECFLRDVGTLEQDLVFGDAGSKELLNLLTTNEVH